MKKSILSFGILPVLFVLFFCSHNCLAGDVGITLITTLSSSYKNTLPLSGDVVSMLSAAKKSDKKEEIAEVLQTLRNGDILVMSVHSNPSVFAIGKEAMHWAYFWEYFGIENPPKLAVVIIGGCMARSFEHNGEKVYVPITEPEMTFIRRRFGTQALFLPKSAINPILARQHIYGYLKHMKEGKRVASYNPGGLWHYVTAPGVNRIGATLEDLRKSAGAEVQDVQPQEKPAFEQPPSGSSKYEILDWSIDQ